MADFDALNKRLEEIKDTEQKAHAAYMSYRDKLGTPEFNTLNFSMLMTHHQNFKKRRIQLEAIIKGLKEELGKPTC